ncbi:MAG: LysM peptidoglycan-binding domain-containing protein [Candidatus Sericytochromatia bacterium]|nr:LysM peptidoglycan-binding domain-containing protein [Candidatus Sericytochromatia bacterium]
MQTSAGRLAAGSMTAPVRRGTDEDRADRPETRPEALPASGLDRVALRPDEIAVVPGDTLSAIARRHGLSLPDLLRMNPALTTTTEGGRPRSADGRWIYPGDKVRLRPDSTPRGLPRLPVATSAERTELPAPKAARPEASPDSPVPVQPGIVPAPIPAVSSGPAGRPRPARSPRPVEVKRGDTPAPGAVSVQGAPKVAVTAPARPPANMPSKPAAAVQPKPAVVAPPKPAAAVDRSGVPELIARIPKGTGTVLGMVNVTIARLGQGLKIQAGSFGTFLFQKTAKGWCIQGAGEEPLAVDRVRQSRDASGNTVFSLEFPKGSPVPFNPAVVSVAPDGKSFSMAGYSISMS